MGSVIDYIDCPRCGSPDCFDDFYYKTGEEYITCNRCGYYKGDTIKNRDKALNELTDEDWHIELVENPYGAFRYKMADGVAYHCGVLETEDEAEEFRIEMERNENGVIDYAAISRFVDGEIKETILIDNLNENQNG